MKRNYPALSAVFFIAFTLLSLAVARYPGIVALDTSIYTYAGLWNTPPWISLNRFITIFGENYFIFSMSAFVSALLFYRRRTKEAVWYLAVIILGMLANYGFKLLFSRQRPEFFDPDILLTTFSYPSGHAFGSIVFYTITYWVLIQAGSVGRKWGLDMGLGITVALIALSRVHLGVHWSMDILGGLLLGAGWIFLSLTAARSLRLFRKKTA